MPRLSRSTVSKQSGFTLIELLTVIAIIAILAAVLLPVLGSARQSAKNATCLGNLHQIGIAIQSYATDNKGSLPPTGFFGISPYYNRDQRNFENSLLNYLALLPSTSWSTSPSADTLAPTFSCPGYQGALGGKCYTLQQTLTTPDGTKISPWGAVNMTGSITTKTAKIAVLPSDAWAIRDNNASATLPNHPGHLNTLFFDWHVSPVVVNN